MAESRPAVIVVVDDEPDIVELVCDVLADAGMHAIPCDHGYQAFACILREHPRVVLLDVQMPQVDGIQLFHLMRGHPQTATTPVIFLTANRHMLERQLPTYQRMGAELLPKPWDVDSLIECVEQALTRSAGALSND